MVVGPQGVAMRSSRRRALAARAKRRGADEIGGLRLLGARAPLIDEMQTTIGVKAHLAVNSLLSGRGSRGDMVHLAYALNVALMLCELGVGSEHIPIVLEAQQALTSCASVSCRLGRWVLDDLLCRPICKGLEIHDAQLDAASHAQVAAAESEIRRRIEIGEIVRTEAVV